MFKNINKYKKITLIILTFAMLNFSNTLFFKETNKEIEEQSAILSDANLENIQLDYIVREDFENIYSQYGYINQGLVDTTDMTELRHDTSATNEAAMLYLTTNGEMILLGRNTDNRFALETSTTDEYIWTEDISHRFKTNFEDYIISATASEHSIGAISVNKKTGDVEVRLGGKNDYSQLGLPNSSYGTPEKLDQTTMNNFNGTPIKIEMSNHATFILTDTGSVYVAGTNANGALGISSANYSQVQDTFLEITDRFACITTGCSVTNIYASGVSSYANNRITVLTDDAAYAWGANYHGSLGVGNHSVTPTGYDSTYFYPDTSGLNFPYEVQGIPSGETIIKVANDYHGSLFLTDNSKVYGVGACGLGFCSRLSATSTSSWDTGSFIGVYSVHTPNLIDKSNLVSTDVIVDISISWRGGTAVTEDGKMYHWHGSSSASQQTYCSNSSSIVRALNTSSTFAFPDGSKILKSFGHGHFSYYVSNTGQMLSCGINYAGALQTGTSHARFSYTQSPVLVKEGKFEKIQLSNSSISFALTILGRDYWPETAKLNLLEDGAIVDTINVGRSVGISYQFVGLLENKTYRVEYVDDYGEILWKAFNFTTDTVAPNVSLFSVNEITFEEVDLEFELEDLKSVLVDSKIQLYSFNGQTEVLEEEVDIVEGHTPSHKFSDLDPNALYKVQIIISYNRFGFLVQDEVAYGEIYLTNEKSLVNSTITVDTIIGGNIEYTVDVFDDEESLIKDPVTGDYQQLRLELLDAFQNVVTTDMNGDPIVLPTLNLGRNSGLQIQNLELSKRFVLQLVVDYDIGVGEENDISISSSAFQTIIATKPSATVTVTSVDYESVLLDTNITDNAGTIYSGSARAMVYEIVNDVETEIAFEILNIGDNQGVTVTGLDSNKPYILAIIADFDRGNGLTTDQKLNTTPIKTSAKQNLLSSLDFTRVGSTSLEFDLAITDFEGALTTDVEVIVENLDTLTSQVFMTIPNIDIDATGYTTSQEVLNLDAFDTYLIKVVGNIDIGYGEKQANIESRLTKTVAYKTPLLNIDSVTTGYDDVFIDIVVDDEDAVLSSSKNGYAELKIFDESGVTELDSIDVSLVGLNSYSFTGLDLNTNYMYRVSLKYNTGRRDITTDKYVESYVKTNPKQVPTVSLDLISGTNGTDNIVFDLDVIDNDFAIDSSSGEADIRIEIWDENFFDDETNGLPVTTLTASSMGYDKDLSSQLINVTVDSLQTGTKYVIKVKGKLITGIANVDAQDDDYLFRAAYIETDPYRQPSSLISNIVEGPNSLNFEALSEDLDNTQRLQVTVINGSNEVLHDQNISITGGITQSFHNVENLISNVQYTIEITAYFLISDTNLEVFESVLDTKVVNTPLRTPVTMTTNLVQAEKTGATIDINIDDKDGALLDSDLSGVKLVVKRNSIVELEVELIKLDDGTFNGDYLDYDLSGLLPGRDYELELVADERYGNTSEVNYSKVFSNLDFTTLFKIKPDMSMNVNSLGKTDASVTTTITDIDDTISNKMVTTQEVVHSTETDIDTFCTVAYYNANKADFSLVGNSIDNPLETGINDVDITGLDYYKCYLIKSLIEFDYGNGDEIEEIEYVGRTSLKDDIDATMENIFVDGIDAFFDINLEDVDGTLSNIEYRVYESGVVVYDTLIRIGDSLDDIMLKDTNNLDDKLSPLTLYETELIINYNRGAGDLTKVIVTKDNVENTETVLTETKDEVKTELFEVDTKYNELTIKVSVFDKDNAIIRTNSLGNNITLQVINKLTFEVVSQREIGLSVVGADEAPYIFTDVTDGLDINTTYIISLKTDYNIGYGSEFDTEIGRLETKTKVKELPVANAILDFQDITTLEIKMILVDSEEAIEYGTAIYRLTGESSGEVPTDVLNPGVDDTLGDNGLKKFEKLNLGERYTLVIQADVNIDGEIRDTILFEETYTTGFKQVPLGNLIVIESNVDNIVVGANLTDANDAIVEKVLTIKANDAVIKTVVLEDANNIITFNDLDSSTQYEISLDVVYNIGDGNDVNEVLQNIDVGTSFDWIRLLASSGATVAVLIVSVFIFRKVRFARV